MKKIIVIVEGRAEVEFIKKILMPYLASQGISQAILPIPISTSSLQKGGFSNYEYFQNDITKNLRSNTNIIVTTFVDFFKFPKKNFPNENCFEKNGTDAMIDCIKSTMTTQFNDNRLIPYVQRHEFEALLFSTNKGFLKYFDSKQSKATERIIQQFPNPEDINTSPQTAPSKRLEAINSKYKKVVLGILIAQEIGIETILQKCPRFAAWVQQLIDRTKELP